MDITLTQLVDELMIFSQKIAILKQQVIDLTNENAELKKKIEEQESSQGRD